MIDHPEPTREPGTRLDLAERLERDAEVAARLHTTGSNRRAADLREAAEALRSAPPDSGARVDANSTESAPGETWRDAVAREFRRSYRRAASTRVWPSREGE